VSRPEHPAGPRRRPQGPKRRKEAKQYPWKWTPVAAAVLALIGASFIVPGLLGSSSATSTGGHASHPITGTGDGPDIGRLIAFDEKDVVDGRPISSHTLRGKKTLLFFSEGIMCQACFEQIRDIESVGDKLERRGIGLVSITPDSADILRQAIDDYAITTPMISDEDRDMSAAFDTLGQGMHADSPGHAFVLIDETGKVVWQRDYWLAPYRTMYVEPAKLLADLTTAPSS
jgi:peroxiredoxin